MYLVLWGGYIASNFYYFGIFQPISGMVKSHPTLHLRLGSNLPHTAWHMLAIILPCMALLGWKRRDLFFRLVELPFVLGVLCHACYIVFRMSDETRWSWVLHKLGSAGVAASGPRHLASSSASSQIPRTLPFRAGPIDGLGLPAGSPCRLGERSPFSISIAVRTPGSPSFYSRWRSPRDFIRPSPSTSPARLPTTPPFASSPWTT